MGIWRLGIDEASGRLVSAPEPIAVGVDVSMDLPHLTADGRTLVFRSMITSVNPAAIAFDPVTERAGAVTLPQHRTGILAPSDLSPDGQWLALANLLERQEDIFVMKADGTELSRLTDDAARDRIPRFTPDGTALVFYSNRDGSYQGWSIQRDGGGRTRVTDVQGDIYYAAVSPSGQQLLAVMVLTSDWIIGPMPGPVSINNGTLTKAPSVSGGEFTPTNWSRDGRWLTGAVTMPSGAYGGLAIYEVASGTVKLSNKDAGSNELAWMPDHRRVLYFTLDGALILQNIETLQWRQVDVTLPLPPDEDFNIVASPDGRTIYYGARHVEANIWKVSPASAAGS